MSKSYDNTIPLFAPRDQLKKLVMGLDRFQAPAAPDTEGSALFQIWGRLPPRRNRSHARAFADGIAWGEPLAQWLFERLDAEIAPCVPPTTTAWPTPKGGSHPAGQCGQGPRHCHRSRLAAPCRGPAQPVCRGCPGQAAKASKAALPAFNGTAGKTGSSVPAGRCQRPADAAKHWPEAPKPGAAIALP